MPTYKTIQQAVKKASGRTVKTCWIAHVKELNGLSVRTAHNREGAERVYPCPAQVREEIERAMRECGILLPV